MVTRARISVPNEVAGYRRPVTTHALEVRVRQGAERVSIERLTKALNALTAALRELDRASAVGDLPRIVWVLRGLTYDEPFFSVRLAARTGPGRDPDSLVRPVDALLDGVQMLARAPELPAFYNSQTVDHLLRLAAPGNGLDGVSLAAVNGVVGQRHDLSPELLGNAHRAVRAREVSLGTVTGTLDLLNAKARTSTSPVRVSVSDAQTRRSVSGTAERGLIDQMRDAWGHRVALIGRVTRNDRGQAVRIDAETIERLPEDDSGRPSTASLLGAAPDWLDGRGVDDYVREARRA